MHTHRRLAEIMQFAEHNHRPAGNSMYQHAGNDTGISYQAGRGTEPAACINPLTASLCH